MRISGRRFFATLIAMVAFAGGLQGMITLYSPSARSVVDYWVDVGLTEKDLKVFIQDDLCQSSQRYFLSCIQSVQSLLSHQNKSLDFEGRFLEDKTLVSKSTERKSLEKWKKWVEEDATRMYRFSFEKLLALALKNLENDPKKSAWIGQSLNSYLSILKDPHTYLLPLKYYQEVISRPQLKTSSFGLNLAQVKENLYLKKVLSDSQAEKAGLQRGDKILRINNKSVVGWALEKVVEEVRQSQFQRLKLLIERDGEQKVVFLKRKPQSIVAVQLKAWALKPEVGVLSITKFASGTCQIVKESLQQDHHWKALIIDLRDNPGGSVDEASCVASLLLGKRLMFTYNYLDRGLVDEEVWGQEEVVYKGPVSVVMNSSTASAAELLAGVLRDYQRALLVGERSFGKGSFQEGEIWEKNSQLLYFKTLGFYYLPSGETPQLQGLKPDVPVKSWVGAADRESDLYMYPLQAYQSVQSLAKNKLNLNRCFSKNPTPADEDSEVSMAAQILECRLGEAKHGSDNSF